MLYTKDESLAGIKQLVEEFGANEACLRNQSEAQIENDYIRPFFRLLNWNTENKGLRVAEFEFVLNRTHRGGKRPDYRLQLDGQHLLFMDAKMVKYDMHDPRWMNQVYSYAYSTQSLRSSRKIDFAILTDFQELVVLDCTFHVKDPRALQNFRVLDLQYRDYPSHFDAVWDLLERENVRAAAKSRDSDSPQGLWGRRLSSKKVKANRISPDKAFLSDMDDDKTGWRILLAKEMKKRNPNADGALITAAVQLLIDRFIFMKVLSDREIEDDYITQLTETVERDGLAEKDSGWFTACQAIFEKLNQFYNGSIFEPRPELEAITVSNRVVRDILQGMQPDHSPYNFAVMPVEILGTIYERFLGRVVRTTEQRVKVEPKPEVKKAGGVYYTPEYIVEYIVQNTVEKILESCDTPEEVAKLKILDPACGSGSFLLGAYSALMNWHTRYYSQKERLARRDRTAAYYDADGSVRLTARLKRQILLNNLYGVDIDPQAIEVTGFSLSLKALEDTRHDELAEEQTLFHQRVLPDLSGNIKCGNSLIGHDYSEGQLVTDPTERHRVNAFDWNVEFKEIMDAGGFDAVIGNPPWISLKGKFGNDIVSTTALAYLTSTYQGDTYRPNMFEYFIKRAISLTKPFGYHSFIVPDRLGFNEQFADFRSKLLDSGRFVSLLYKARFPNVIADTLVYVYVPGKTDTKLEIEIGEFHGERTLINQDRFNLFQDSQFLPISPVVQKVYYDSTDVCPLGELVSSSVGFIAKPKMITDKRVNDHQVPILRGRNIGRYSLSGESFFRFSKVNLAGGTQDEIKLSAGRKILLRKTGYPLLATYDTSASYPEQSLYFLFDPRRSMDLRYILGIVNSKLFQYVYWSWMVTNRDATPQLKKIHLDQFPLRIIDPLNIADKTRHDRMVQLVESMLQLQKDLGETKTDHERTTLQRQIDATDKQIDSLVYELYGLTEEEIKIVENNAAG